MGCRGVLGLSLSFSLNLIILYENETQQKVVKITFNANKCMT